MLNRLKPLWVLPCALALAGCFSSNILITVRPDGSGTLQYTAWYRPSGMAQFDALIPADRDARPRLPEDIIAGELVERARLALPRDLKLVSERPLRTGDRIGATSTFEFTDISTLPVDLVPRTPVPMYGFLPAVRASANTHLTMSLAPAEGGNRLLTIRFPRFRLDPSTEPPGAWATGTVEEMSRLKSAFKDARTTIIVETETPLLRTNSPHHTDNRVVLFDMDAQQALFGRQIDMLRATPASFDELLSMLGDLPGVTLAPDHVVTLEFAGDPQPAQTAQVAPPQAPPDTEIFLAPLTKAGGTLTVGTPVNISNSPGYDNQPSFLPDGRGILFTSSRGGAAASSRASAGAAVRAPQTDIYRYDMASRQIVRLTNTPESEYSPTVVPDGTRFSVVRVEADATQRLWSFTLDGRNPALVLSEIKPVGYHAWIDDRTLALFILGAGGGVATLQVADTRTGKAVVAAEDIGRCIQKTPSGHISFVQRVRGADNTPALTIKRLLNAGEPGGDAVWQAVPVQPVPGTTDLYHAWMPDGTLLLAQGSTLYSWRQGETVWSPIVDLGARGLTNLSRLAVSPKGDYLAIVAEVR